MRCRSSNREKQLASKQRLKYRHPIHPLQVSSQRPKGEEQADFKARIPNTIPPENASDSKMFNPIRGSLRSNSIIEAEAYWTSHLRTETGVTIVPPPQPLGPDWQEPPRRPWRSRSPTARSSRPSPRWALAGQPLPRARHACPSARQYRH